MEPSREVIEVDPGLEPLAVSDPSGSLAVRLAVPMLLAAGWGALIAFSVVFLVDEAKLDSASAATERLPVVEPAGFDRIADHIQPAQATGFLIGNPSSAPSLEADASQGKGTPRLRTVSTAVTPAEALSDSVPASTPPAPPVARADFIGTWGPNPAACGTQSRRRGYLPATITEESARAGKTLCRFRNSRRDGPAWTMAADCSERGRNWTSQVRLVVDGDRLTWSSAKGKSSYIRCGRREG